MRAIFRPRIGASKRTKNRLTEHTGFFTIMSSQDALSLFQGRPAVLLACECHEEAWVGWLPSDEMTQGETQI